MLAAQPLRRRRLVVACGGLALAGASLLAACGEPTPSTKDLTDALVASGVPKAEASCTAKAVTETLSKAELQKLVERGSGGAPVDDPKDQGDTADRLRKAMDACRALGTTTTVVPTTLGPGDLDTTTTAP
ncbi:MAG: hypothetical protein U0P45_15180 [Acidimicrobiales bacterium]